MRFDGAAALKLDFGGVSTTWRERATGTPTPLRLAPRQRHSGPEKYRDIEHRRRQAQIRARHLLDLVEEAR